MSTTDRTITIKGPLATTHATLPYPLPEPSTDPIQQIAQLMPQASHGVEWALRQVGRTQDARR